MRTRMGRILVLMVIATALTVSIGGGGTYIALKATTTPQFCSTCHLMQPYYDSWATSSHNHVTCVDCHFEPGVLETIEGKMQAVVMLTKYLTNTEGTKPWAHVSDYSCMRSGCHSTRLLQGEIEYGRIQFDHRPHLTGFPKGKTLRCTSCHSQIVQGDHVSVTPTACFLCHFTHEPPLTADGNRRINDCNLCHGPPPDEIKLGDFSFRHSDYLERGVMCDSCHGDVTRGKGEVPRARCRSCHNTQEHFDRYDDVEFMHQQHVRDHSVACIECHTEIEHGLPPNEEHFQRDCTDCHLGSHGAPSSMYRGTGGVGVPDDPSVMFRARVTCNGCHRAKVPGLATPAAGETYRADPLACIDCHGVGFEGMAERWQAAFRREAKDVGQYVAELAEMIGEEWEEEADFDQARAKLDVARTNLRLVVLDKSDGVHNLPYARALLRRAVQDTHAGMLALDPEASKPRVQIGPLIESKQGCTMLCHVGVEQAPVARAFDYPFPHARHLTRARLDCAECHDAEPHGTVRIEPVNCADCHHKQDDPETCAGCHVEIAALRSAELEDPSLGSMLELDCLACHETIADGHSTDAVRKACVGCHEDEDFGGEIFDDWIAEAAAPLEGLKGEEADRLRRAGPFHNSAYVAERAKKLK